MIKGRTGKVLTQGTLKQRLKLFYEDLARKRFGEDLLLTDHESNALFDSFSKDNEAKEYNRLLAVDQAVIHGLTNLQVLLFQVKMHYADLRGYMLLWQNIEDTELMANKILNEIEDVKERKRLAKLGALRTDPIFCKNKVDEEGFIDIQIDAKKGDKENSLRDIMSGVQEQATTTAIRFISWRDAILDYMKEEGLNVKTYRDRIKVYSGEVLSPVLGWPKYQSGVEGFIDGMPFRADNLKEYYSLAPNPKKIKPDPEIYYSFKEQILRNG